MKTFSSRALSAVAAVALCVAAGAAGGLVLATVYAPAAPAAGHTVNMGASSFTPSALTINAGDTVTWVHDSGAIPHSVTSDTGAFDSNPNCPPTCMDANSTYSHTFNQA